MQARGIVIAGTRGAGKSTLAKRLSGLAHGFTTVAVHTTRAQRLDDVPGNFIYIDPREFAGLTRSGSFEVTTTYKSALYGLSASALNSVLTKGLRPTVVTTPEAAHRLLASRQGVLLTGVFIDAPDSSLDARLARRGVPPDQLDLALRAIDRTFNRFPLTYFENLDERLEGVLGELVRLVVCQPS